MQVPVAWLLHTTMEMAYNALGVCTLAYVVSSLWPNNFACVL